ncbi:MAG: PQQ-binding-like beta-propeller repeat protein [Gammaproteobacteria bacterium]
MFVRFISLIICLCLGVSSFAEPANLSPRWVYEFEAPFDKPPMIGQGIIIAAPSSGSVNALATGSGRFLWQLPQGTVWDRGVTLAGDVLITCNRDSTVSRRNPLTGAVLWVVDLGDLNCQRDALISDEAIYISTTYVGPGLSGEPLTGAKLFKLDKHTGAIHWQFTSETYLLQTASVDSGRVVIGGSYVDQTFTEDEGGPSYYYGLDDRTGTLLWRYRSFDGLPKTVLVSGDRVAYVAYQDFIQALDARTGKPVWRRDTENWVSALLGTQHYVYFGSANTIVHAWDLKDGATNWRYNMPGSSFEYLLVAPRLVGQTIWFVSQKGQIFALSQSSGELCYTQSTGVVSRIDADFQDGVMAIGDQNGKLFVFDLPRSADTICRQ